jgi:hypothetical protein
MATTTTPPVTTAFARGQVHGSFSTVCSKRREGKRGGREGR